jgi:hypothetical protein
MRSTRWAWMRAKTVLMAAGAALAVAGSGVTAAQAVPVGGSRTHCPATVRRYPASACLHSL